MKPKTNISDLLGLGTLNETEQAVMLDQIGGTVLQSVLLRLVSELSSEQTAALGHYLESEPDSDTLMKHLTETYPQFQTLFEEEVVALQTEMQAVLGDTTSDRN